MPGISKRLAPLVVLVTFVPTATSAQLTSPEARTASPQASALAAAGQPSQGAASSTTPRTLAAWVALLGGAGLVAGAFNYAESCDTSRRFYNPNQERKCTVWHDEGGYSEGVASLGVTGVGRPWMVYSGAAAIGIGALLLTVWSEAPVQVAPDRVTLTLRW